jgi:hypothetical protein
MSENISFLTAQVLLKGYVIIDDKFKKTFLNKFFLNQINKCSLKIQLIFFSCKILAVLKSGDVA